MKNLLKKSLLAPGVALLLTACGPTALQEEVAPESQELLTACAEQEALAEVAEHACFHGEFGPFESVTAAPLGTVSFADVSTPHVGYHITLPADATFRYGGSVMFMPEESGEYAFLLSRQRGLRIFNGDTEVARECRYTVPGEVCGTLRTAIVADLEAGVDYRLEFKAVAPRNSQFTLVIEEAGHHDEHVE